MKKISLMFVAFIFVFECFGQSSSKEVIYGTVRADGYQKITKSAMWAIRPEAKIIYEGGHPTGYTVVVLDQDYFVRFVDGENNQFDRNYIVFPKGSVVYIDDKTDQFYSAICGNKIEYIRAVNLVEFKTDVVQQSNSSSTNEIDDWGAYKSPRKLFESYEEEEINPNYSNSVEEKEKLKFFKRKGVRIIGGAIVGLGVVYLGDKLVSLLNSDYIDTVETRTMSPGIPAVEPRTTPGLPSDSRTMPGGIGFKFNF